MRSAESEPALQVQWLGQLDYETALARQLAQVERRRAGQGSDVLWLLEHPPVITVGRSGKGVGPEVAAEKSGGIPVVAVSRGGEATYHGPGQLVGYPILDLRGHKTDLHWYLRQLEEVLIQVLSKLGVTGVRQPPYTGVWVGERKVASIGVAVRGWVTYHGFALNVAGDLANFGHITPCGLPAEVMGQLADYGVTATVEEAGELAGEVFREFFG